MCMMTGAFTNFNVANIKPQKKISRSNSHFPVLCLVIKCPRRHFLCRKETPCVAFLAFVIAVCKYACHDSIEAFLEYFFFHELLNFYYLPYASQSSATR